VTGDFDGDGRVDIAVAEDVGVFSLDQVVLELLRGRGDGSFQTTTPVELGGFFPVSLVTGDFNGDGRVDIAVADAARAGGTSTQQLQILLGRGDGTFLTMTPINLGLSGYGGLNPVSLVTGDFNGDGRTDLAVAGFADLISKGEVEVLLSQGDGIFQGPTLIGNGLGAGSLAAGDFIGLVSLAVGDFNGDGRADLAVAGGSQVNVLLGLGDGTFQAPILSPLGFYYATFLAADFNGDGRSDLTDGGQVGISLGNGEFASPSDLAAPLDSSPTVADPGDGTNDVFIVKQDGDILWRKGDPGAPGSFSPPITINPGFPSRDITFIASKLGPVLASVDVVDDAVSLYAYRNGTFVRMGSLATGAFPIRVATADLNSDGNGDLVVLDAGDDAADVYLGDGIGGFARGDRVPVGFGVSAITLADVQGTGHPDLVLTGQVTGLVIVLPGRGDGTFGAPSIYPASGGPYGVNSSASAASTVTSSEAAAGVAIGTFTPGGNPGLATVDPGTNSFAMLTGLGGGALANPVRGFTSTPASLVRAGDFNGDGLSDLVLLGANGVTIELNDGRGGFHPTATFNVGPDPTGLTLADVNHDGKLDLLIGNALGDILVLLGNGDGTFRPYRRLDQNVALAVLPTSSPTPEFIFADQGLDRVVVASGSQSTVVGNRSTGILDPGAVQLADLNGDGIPDLIVVNRGGNNVLVYPGLGNGQFGPELNGGNGFFTGTDPVSVTVADVNGDGRPDLVVADNGSNDVTILLNQATAGGGFTLTQGLRLQGGQGPTSTVVQDVNGDGIPDILVSDGNSNQVTLLPGVGNGFFNDQNPRTFPVGSNPNQIMVGTFLPGRGPEILTVNQGSNDVTVISDFTTFAPAFDTFSTGGIEPVSALAVEFAGQSFESLIVANTGDGLFTLLGGEEGLQVEQTLSHPELPQPSALALAALSGNAVSFYATTAGMEAAFTLAFILPGFTPSPGPVPGSSGALAEAPGQLIALSETSLAVVGTLLVTALSAAPGSTLAVATESEAEAGATTALAFASLAPSQGQSLFTGSNAGEPGNSEETETAPQVPLAPDRSEGQAPVPATAAPPWARSVLSLDRIFEEIREEHQEALPARDKGETATDEESATTPAPQPAGPVRSRDQDERSGADAVDAVIETLGSVSPWEGEAPAEPLAGVTPGLGRSLALPEPATSQPGDPTAVGLVLATAAVMIVRASPPAGPGAKLGHRGSVDRNRVGGRVRSRKNRAAS
jgi:hypothetical protein